MKKSVLALAMAFGVTSAFAQDLTSKKGEPILPEAGDWAIGIQADPFLNTAANFFHGTGTTATPSWNFLNGNQMITGKYFKDEKTAYRAGIRLGMQSQTYRNQISDASVTTAPTFPALPTMKEDKYKHGQTNVGISVGLEKRRGKTRLQGYYGADLQLWMSSSKDKFTYGNALAPTATTPVTSTDPTYTTFFDASGNSTAYGSSVNGNDATYGGRATLKKSGTTIGFGVRAFIGAEYFILPKISIGGEFGWGVGVAMTGKSKNTYEATNGTSNGSYTVEGSKSGKFLLDTDNSAFGTNANQWTGASAALRLNLHF